MLNPVKGFLLEYALSVPPLVLAFDFNPQQITRSSAPFMRCGEKFRGANTLNSFFDLTTYKIYA